MDQIIESGRKKIKKFFEDPISITPGDEYKGIIITPGDEYKEGTIISEEFLLMKMDFFMSNFYQSISNSYEDDKFLLLQNDNLILSSFLFYILMYEISYGSYIFTGNIYPIRRKKGTYNIYIDVENTKSMIFGYIILHVYQYEFEIGNMGSAGFVNLLVEIFKCYDNNTNENELLLGKLKGQLSKFDFNRKPDVKDTRDFYKVEISYPYNPSSFKLDYSDLSNILGKLIVIFNKLNNKNSKFENINERSIEKIKEKIFSSIGKYRDILTSTTPPTTTAPVSSDIPLLTTTPIITPITTPITTPRGGPVLLTPEELKRSNEEIIKILTEIRDKKTTPEDYVRKVLSDPAQLGNLKKLSMDHPAIYAELKRAGVLQLIQGNLNPTEFIQLERIKEDIRPYIVDGKYKVDPRRTITPKIDQIKRKKYK